MKNLLLLLISLSVSISFAQDMTSAVEKVSSKWDEKVENCPKTFGNYTVYLKNASQENIDCQICLQNNKKDWVCKEFLGLTPGTEFSYGVCKGSGKYLKWARKTGDEKIKFPTEMAVNNLY